MADEHKRQTVICIPNLMLGESTGPYSPSQELCFCWFWIGLMSFLPVEGKEVNDCFEH